METVTSRDGTQIAYWRSGAGPPLVLVHGATDDRSAWQVVAPMLEPTYTLLVVNRRGRESSGPLGGGPIEREFEDIAAVVDAAGEPVHLLGHSYGAHCALGAAMLTRNVCKLILYEPPLVRDTGGETYQLFRQRLDAGGADAALTGFFGAVGVPPGIIDTMRAAPTWRDRHALAEAVYEELRALGEHDFRPERFRSLQTPTVLLLGGDSERAQYANDELAGVLPNSRLAVMRGQGHIAMFTAPQLFADEVVRFLSEA